MSYGTKKKKDCKQKSKPYACRPPLQSKADCPIILNALKNSIEEYKQEAKRLTDLAMEDTSEFTVLILFAFLIFGRNYIH